MRLCSVCFLVFIIIILMPFISSAGPIGPYTGQVIDTQTGEPVQGASVLIYWEKGMPSAGGEVTDFIKAKLAYTDHKGEYSIPPTILNTGLLGYLSSTVFIIYQPGYQAYIVRIFRGPDKSFKQINNIVKLDRVPPNFDYEEHYDHIASVLAGIESHYNILPSQESSAELDRIIRMDLQGVHLREEFLRRVRWEERRQ